MSATEGHAHPAPGGSSPAWQRFPLPLVGLAFLVSGGAGLVYQVAWQRILALHSGVGIYSVAMIVAAFMAGLGAGSLAGGAFSARVSRRRALLVFGLLEAGIGVFGAASCWLYYDLLYLKAVWLYSPLWRAGLLHFFGLLLPTALMGMTLPFLVRATVQSGRTAGRTVGWLYGVNALGASVGAYLTPWVLIPMGGIRGAVLAAAAGNALAALTALALIRALPSDEALSQEPAAEVGGGTSPGQPWTLWVALYGLSGFAALSLEVIWFRVLDLGVKSTAFTFGTLLALYLLGLALGCLAGTLLAARLVRPLGAFLFLQCLLLGCAGLAICILGYFPVDVGPFDAFYAYWAQGGFGSGGLHGREGVFRLYVALPLFLFGLPTLLMGFSFPILQRAVHDQARTSGRKVGILQAANIAGCVAGSLLVGLLGLSWLGSTGSLRLLMVLGVAFAVTGARLSRRPGVFVASAAMLGLLAIGLPGQERFWKRLHGTEAPEALVEEDASGVSALVESAPGRWGVYVNGKAHSWLPFGGIHSQLGAMPALIHPAPRDVAIIGLGSGDTAWASACRSETGSLTVFEISAPQPRLLARLGRRSELADLGAFLSDPRLRVVIADGRSALAHGTARYDILEADALWPHVGYSGNLYSVEFFRECARKLKPGGIMCTWAPTPRVVASFSAVFPHLLKNDARTVFVGSLAPLPEDRGAWLARLDSPHVSAYLGAPVSRLVRQQLSTLARPHKQQRYLARDYNLDLYPRDEFTVR